METAVAKKGVPTEPKISQTVNGDSTSNSTSGMGSGGGGCATEGAGDDAQHTIKISRKVMSAKQWLTIEDWLECGLPLCPLEIKHGGRIERTQENIVQAVFTSPRLGGSVLSSGNSQVRYCGVIAYIYF